MNDKSIFDASASALGYIYQVRYALLLALQKSRQVNNPDDCFVSIEKLDDIAFEEGSDPVELLQAKYHGIKGNLTDRSPDLWKTIRIWSEMVKDKKFESASFTLLTTEIAGSGSIAEYLGLDNSKRDIDKAHELMREISLETNNKTNLKAYKMFSSLEHWQQRSLLNSTYVICNSSTILDVEQKIKNDLRLTVSSHHIEAFTTRLEGAWFKRTIQAMSFEEQSRISLGELISILDDLRIQFLPGNLPSDYDDIEPGDIDIESDDRVFVEQLRLIGATDRVIKNAVVNYYRAFEQRSRWSRDNLVKPGELKVYLNLLKDEWEQRSSLLELEHDFTIESEKLASGKKLYQFCQIDGAKPIRPEFKSAYVARGTYHDLSDKKSIGWHPDYREKLQSLSEEEVA